MRPLCRWPREPSRVAWQVTSAGASVRVWSSGACVGRATGRELSSTERRGSMRCAPDGEEMGRQQFVHGPTVASAAGDAGADRGLQQGDDLCLAWAPADVRTGEGPRMPRVQGPLLHPRHTEAPGGRAVNSTWTIRHRPTRTEWKGARSTAVHCIARGGPGVRTVMELAPSVGGWACKVRGWLRRGCPAVRGPLPLTVRWAIGGQADADRSSPTGSPYR